MEDRIFALQRTIRDLVEQIHESNKKDIPSELFPRGSVGEGQSFSDRETLMDFNEDITLTACEKVLQCLMLLIFNMSLNLLLV